MNAAALALLLAGPTGTLTLDLERPRIAAAIGGRMLNLAVDLDQKDAIELNPEVVARLGLVLPRRFDASVGRVTVPGRIGEAEVTIGGTTARLPVATHDRPCCSDSDGIVSPAVLPYAEVRLVHAGPPAGQVRTFPLAATEPAGSFVRVETEEGRLAVQFSLRYRETLATASGAAILARLHGGAFTGPPFESRRAFGVGRPARLMVLDEPATLAGFAVPRLTVRIADFRGGFSLPSDAAEPGEIAVRGKAPPSQHAWPVVIVGRDEIDRCSEIVVRKQPAEIALRCAW